MNIGAFFSGGVEPYWPHFVLIGIALLGSAAVTWGLVREADKFWSVTNVLIVGGVILEATCTILLFGFDEGISNAQQAKIIELSPRDFGREEQSKLVADCRQFVGSDLNAAVVSQHADSEGFRLGGEIIAAFNKLGLKTADERGEASVSIGTPPSFGLGIWGPPSEIPLINCVAKEPYLERLLTQPAAPVPEGKPLTVVIGLKPIPE